MVRLVYDTLGVLVKGPGGSCCLCQGGLVIRTSLGLLGALLALLALLLLLLLRL